MENEIRHQIQELMNKKHAIEKEILHNRDILHAQQEVGMDGPLLDHEQFPRSDIDLVIVRSARNKVICLENDFREVMKKIEAKLHELHTVVGPNGHSSTPMDVDEASELPENQQSVFARINQVDPNSPASSAGFQVGDEVVQFGTVSQSNFQNLQSIASVVQHSQGKPVAVIVIRDGRALRLSVTPKTWSGRGLLGKE